MVDAMLKVREIVQVPDGPNVKVAEATRVFIELRREQEARDREKKEKKAQARRKSARKGR